MAGYTIVQHSAFVANGDTQFEGALETRSVANRKQEDYILRLGGLVFPDWVEADNYAMREQYREVPEPGLIAKAPGTFSNYKVDGCPLYLPREKP